MADTQYTINVTDTDQLVLARMADEYNSARPAPPSVLSPAQFLRQHVREWIRSQAGRFLERDQLGMRAAYNSAPADVQAVVDAALAPYR